MNIDLFLISPEIALAGIALLILVLDLIFMKSNCKEWLGWLAALGAIFVLAVLISMREAQGVVLEGFLVDGFAFYFKLIFLAAGALCCLASAGFASKYLRYPGEFFALILFAVLGFMIMASAGDLIILYLGLELGTISLYALSAMHKERPRSGEAGLKFLIMGAVSSAIFLYGASLLYGSLGTVVFADMPKPPDMPGFALIIGVVMVLAAFSFKITAVPFHMWAPDVYQGAPTPITGFLSVASKAAGFAVLLRLLFGPLFLLIDNWLPVVMLLSVLSMVVGNLLAIPQTNIKRMLAYSSIAQAGYVLIALAAGNEKGAASAIFFLLQYLFTNFGAFIVVMIVGSASGNDNIRAYAGLSRRNPLVAFCMLILLLSLGGIPPLSGFWSKLFIFWAGAEQELYFLVLIGVLAAVLALYYYLMVARQMYIENPEDTSPLPVSFSAGLALGICTLLVVALGYPKPWMDLAFAVARAFNLGG